MTIAQEALQASIRALTGSNRTLDEDWMTLFDAEGIAAGTFEERYLTWLNTRLGSSQATLADAQHAFAVAQGKTQWSDVTEIREADASIRTSLHFGTETYRIHNGSNLVSYGLGAIPNSTFTRNSLALGFTKPGSDIVLTEHAVDAPRLVVDPVTGVKRGYLAELAATNLLPNSNNFDDAHWDTSAGGTITPNSAIGLDGEMDAVLVDLSAGGSARAFNVQGTIVDGENYVASVFLRSVSGTGTRPLVAFSNGGGSVGKLVTLTEEWQRFDVPFVAAGNGGGGLYLGHNSFVGGATLTQAYAKCAQLEAGSVPTS